MYACDAKPSTAFTSTRTGVFASTTLEDTGPSSENILNADSSAHSVAATSTNITRPGPCIGS